MLSYKRRLTLFTKNLLGWRTARKIVVFSIDDFGNVLLTSKSSRENLRRAGLNIDGSRFSQYDALENAEDLSMLFEVLHSVKDQHGGPAVFTAFAMPANIAFEQIEAGGYEKYAYELLPDTLARLPGYEGTWNLWREGITQGFFVPEFHGREHLNIRLFERLLQKRDPELMACLGERSYVAISTRPPSRVGFTEAFSFDDFSEIVEHQHIIKSGLDVFEQVFGRRAVHFNAPGAREHHVLEKTMLEGGIHFIDTDIVKNEHQGQGVFKRRYHTFGSVNQLQQTYIFRNCVFEPNLGEQSDWVDTCLAEIDIAFRCGKPANISSHRVNFTGRIEPGIRDKGLYELKRLLQTITRRWPDVEFMSSAQLGQIIAQ